MIHMINMIIVKITKRITKKMIMITIAPTLGRGGASARAPTQGRRLFRAKMV